MKKETIIYGGAFNPPTRAHVAILKACADYAVETNADVWILPSGNRTDKTIAVSRARRLEYVEALIKDAIPDTPVSVDARELDRPIAIETFDTLQELEKDHPDRSFIFVFGADSTETMGDWKEGDLLLRTLPMLLVERPGSVINPEALLANTLNVQTLNVSSTKVRQCLEAGEPIDEYVSPSVAKLLC